jgi:hypothetical protein
VPVITVITAIQIHGLRAARQMLARLGTLAALLNGSCIDVPSVLGSASLRRIQPTEGRFLVSYLVATTKLLLGSDIEEPLVQSDHFKHDICRVIPND